MDSQIEVTWKKNGCVVRVPEQERLIHTLLSSYK
jgi:hypothetical protein